MSAGKKKDLILNNDAKNEAEEIQDAFNAIKDHSVENGEALRSAPVVVSDFAGKSLAISKSVVIGSQQHTVKAGTKWEDIELFFRKNIKFSSKDFKKVGE